MRFINTMRFSAEDYKVVEEARSLLPDPDTHENGMVKIIIGLCKIQTSLTPRIETYHEVYFHKRLVPIGVGVRNIWILDDIQVKLYYPPGMEVPVRVD